MSRENLEIVRRYLDEVSREPSERVGEFWETDGDHYPARKSPEARPCHGRKEIVRFITEYLAAWEDYRYLVKDARAVGDDRVLVHGRVRRFIRVEDHLTEKGALHALGLSDDTLEAAGLWD